MSFFMLTLLVANAMNLKAAATLDSLAGSNAPFLNRAVDDTIKEHLDIPKRTYSSGGGGTENMEYLMNRCRGDSSSHCRSEQEQVAMEHAIGILRAAGMHVDSGEQIAARIHCGCVHCIREWKSHGVYEPRLLSCLPVC
jgi:hypothetical protein